MIVECFRCADTRTMKQRHIRIEVKGHALGLSSYETSYVRMQLSRSLKQFSLHLRNVTVRITDLNGPRGGDSDLECRVVVDGDFPTVVVSERAESVTAAIDVAADRASHTVARAIGRVRTQARRLG
jgi:putative sigma-54 modulation protein